MKTRFDHNQPHLVIKWDQLFSAVFVMVCYLFGGWLVKLVSGWSYKDSLIIALLFAMAVDIAFIRAKGVGNE